MGGGFCGAVGLGKARGHHIRVADRPQDPKERAAAVVQGVGQVIVEDRREGVEEGAKPAQGDAGLVDGVGAVVGHEEGQVGFHRSGQAVGKMQQSRGWGHVLRDGDVVCSGKHDGLRRRGAGPLRGP